MVTVMTDVNCLLAGLIRLFTPLLLLILWHKKTGARLFPAPVAFLICFPVFILGAAIRSGFGQDDPLAYYIQQGLLYGILEEGTKYLVLCFLLTSYDSRKDAVTYGIGHGAYEAFGAGMACFGLIGLDAAAPDILWMNLWMAVEAAAFCIGLTVLIFYGIYTGKSKVMLPVAILLHAVCNAVGGILIEFIVIPIRILLTAGICFAAYRCWQEMGTPYEDEA